MDCAALPVDIMPGVGAGEIKCWADVFHRVATVHAVLGFQRSRRGCTERENACSNPYSCTNASQRGWPTSCNGQSSHLSSWAYQSANICASLPAWDKLVSGTMLVAVARDPRIG